MQIFTKVEWVIFAVVAVAAAFGLYGTVTGDIQVFWRQRRFERGNIMADARGRRWSEAGKLRRGAGLSAGLAHDQLTPDTAEDLLYDDVTQGCSRPAGTTSLVAKMAERGVEVLEPTTRICSNVVADSAARTAGSTIRSPMTKVGAGYRQGRRAAVAPADGGEGTRPAAHRAWPRSVRLA